MEDNPNGIKPEHFQPGDLIIWCTHRTPDLVLTQPERNKRGIWVFAVWDPELAMAIDLQWTPGRTNPYVGPCRHIPLGSGE